MILFPSTTDLVRRGGVLTDERGDCVDCKPLQDILSLLTTVIVMSLLDGLLGNDNLGVTVHVSV